MQWTIEAFISRLLVILVALFSLIPLSLCSIKMVLDVVYSSTSDAFGDFGPFVADFLVPFDQYPFLIFIPFTFLKVWFTNKMFVKLYFFFIKITKKEEKMLEIFFVSYNKIKGNNFFITIIEKFM